MKISDFILDFKDNIKHRDSGFCRIRIFTYQEKLVVIITELENNDGQSVTNSIEYIVRYLYEYGNLVKGQDVLFVEHYDKSINSCYYTNFSFELVTFENSISNPKWESIKLQKMIDMIGNDFIDELKTNSLENKIIYDKTERIISEHKKYNLLKTHRDKDYVLREIKIEKNKKTKSEFKQLIESGAKERKDILPFLHSDLSLIGETYDYDEYIVIPEFPLDDGFIDFVVFTGRSRMDVIFIEVKGADFNLLNQSGYNDFNTKIHQAAKQLRDRINSAVYTNYHSFCDKCHQIRQSIEDGKYSKAHLLSPKGKLLVDPNKDIVIRTVIIGGRSQDDYKESRERHNFERESSRPTTVDSWDSWINRLKRD